MDGIRLNKYLAEAGIASRRHADALIEAGEITVNDTPATLGSKIFPGDRVFYQGRLVTPVEEDVFLLFNKPPGIVCTAEKREKNNVIDYIGYPTRIYPIGRLDKDSRGLLLLTNRGDSFNDIIKGRSAHEKEYHVTVNRPVSNEALSNMARGVYLPELDVTTRPCKIQREGKNQFQIILTQGLNRQIRRMCETQNLQVRDLFRSRIMNLSVEGIEEGSYRSISLEEQAELERLLGKKLF